MISLYVEISGDFLQRTENLQFFWRHRRYSATERKILVHIVVALERRIENGYRAFDDGTIFELIYVIVVDLRHSFTRLRAQPFARYTFAIRCLRTHKTTS